MPSSDSELPEIEEPPKSRSSECSIDIISLT